VTIDFAIFLKLLLATAGFLLVAHYGARDRRAARGEGILLEDAALLKGVAHVVCTENLVRLRGLFVPKTSSR
jgi:hypothetical protein